MIGGWTVAAAAQASFDPVEETISALAAEPAASPWIMTTGLAVTGACHVVTAWGLRPAQPAARVLLAVGGVATALVAALPVSSRPAAHGAAAAVAFVALTAWPAPAGGTAAPGRTGRSGVWATAVLSLLLGWFVLELQQVSPDRGATTGLAERALAGAQSLWPLVAVLTVRRRLSRRP